METVLWGGVKFEGSDSDGSAIAPFDVLVAPGSEASPDLTSQEEAEECSKPHCGSNSRKCMRWYGLLDQVLKEVFLYIPVKLWRCVG